MVGELAGFLLPVLFYVSWGVWGGVDEGVEFEFLEVVVFLGELDEFGDGGLSVF